MRLHRVVKWAVFLLLFCVEALASQLILKDGKVVEGTLVRQNEESVIWKDKTGMFHNFSKAEIDLQKTTGLSVSKSKTSARVFTANDLAALRQKYDLGQGSYGENTRLKITPPAASGANQDSIAWFRNKVLDEEVPVLVEFWATWCGPCRKIAPVIDKLASDYEGKAKVIKIDIDKNKRIAAEYKVDAIPFMLFFKDGELKHYMIGVVPENQITSKLDELI